MKFSGVKQIEAVIENMKTAEDTRSANRALIDKVFNGHPPYSDKEQEENQISTNVNFLEGTSIAADARRQFYNAFLKPGSFFSVKLNSGPIHRRSTWSTVITQAIRKRTKQSREYMEELRSMFAIGVLHGKPPMNWPNEFRWRPCCLSVDDVLIPSRTLLSMDNLEFFAVRREYTSGQLWRIYSNPGRDPGWKDGVLKRVIQETDKDALTALGMTTEEDTPEKIEERYKENSGYYTSDAIPPIKCWDFYFWSDERGEAGWRRKIILQEPPPSEGRQSSTDSDRDRILYNPGDRVYAAKLSQILHFQFADCSAVAPFRYHTVRSLGFLLYSVCHLQNRLRCKFNDSVFESLLQYFRVSNPEDMNRLRKVDLVNMGIIPQGLDWVKAQDRYQPDMQLIEAALAQNRQNMMQSASAYRQPYDFGERKPQQTATQVMAEANAASALIGAILMEGYNYFQYQCNEIARRFCIKNSPDPEVQSFRLECLKAGVPEEYLDTDCWDVVVERVLGRGNKTLEIAQANQLMEIRPLFDPDPQRDILRDAVLAYTDDPDRATRYVPPQPIAVSDAAHDAELASGALMQGLPVRIKTGIDHIDYIEVLIRNMAMICHSINTTQGGMAEPDQVSGLMNMFQHTQQHIAILEQNNAEKARVRQYQNDLKELENYITGYAQRLQEQQQGQGPQIPPETIGKIEAMRILAEAKAANTRESHAQRTAQRQAAWELEQRRLDETHRLDMARKSEQSQVDIALEDADAAAGIMRQTATKTKTS